MKWRSKDDRIDALDPVFWERSGFRLRLWRLYFEFRWLKRVPRDPNNNVYLRKIDGAPWARHASAVSDFKRPWSEGEWDDGYDWKPVKREGDPR